MCPQVGGGGDGLQIWKVAVNISNKKSQGDEGWYSSMGIECRTNNPSMQKK
jgi:hypothetical protein